MCGKGSKLTMPIQCPGAVVRAGHGGRPSAVAFFLVDEYSIFGQHDLCLKGPTCPNRTQWDSNHHGRSGPLSLGRIGCDPPHLTSDLAGCSGQEERNATPNEW